MCRAQPVSPVIAPVTRAKLGTFRPRPRRSKLRRLQRLQKKARAQKPDEKLPGLAKKRLLVEEDGLSKRQKVDEIPNSDAAAAEKDSAVVSKSQPCAAAAVLRRLDDAALRKQLQLRIEDDPYGNCPAPVASFAELKLPQHVLSSLARHGITAPMPIQAQAIPLVLSGRDVIGLAQTGSGKTLAFLLPASVHLEKQKLSQQPRLPSPFVLILAPTRELAVQIADEANKVFDRSQCEDRNNQVHTVSVYGGADKWTQQKNLQWGGGAHIVVATPGRLADFVESRVLSLNRVSYFVLDEADRMLDMGFQDEVATISKQCQPQRQQLFFSATWSTEVQGLAAGLCRNGSKPVRISYGQSNDLSSDGTPAKHKAREGIVQEVVVVDHPGNDNWEKQEAEKDVIMEKHLRSVLTASPDHKVLVFVSQKTKADKLSDRLQKQGFKADAMHGGKSQASRLWVLEQFRKGELRLLVCTDVLGRGIDIPSVSHVVIHEMGEIEDYVHRIGRTARGQYGKGHALVFFEYWDGSPSIASELIDLLEASKQPVPAGLQKIANEVASGKRKIRAGASDGQKWNSPSFSKQGNRW